MSVLTSCRLFVFMTPSKSVQDKIELANDSRVTLDYDPEYYRHI